LKRYSSYGEGHFKRLNTYVDIPLEIKLPHFISDGSEDDGFGSSFTRFKLSLQSVICHRGVVLEMGHYVALVRPSAEEAMAGFEEGQPDPKYQWYMHDDLAKENRITRVDIRQALKEETPYLVFYQVQPIDDFDELDEYPPTYAEATGSNPTPPAGSSTTFSMPSNSSFSTVLGTESSSPPLAAVGSNRSDPHIAMPPASPIALPASATQSGIETSGSPDTVIRSTASSSGATPPLHLDAPTSKISNTVAGAASLQIPPYTSSSNQESHDSIHQSRHGATTSISSTMPSIPSGLGTPSEEVISEAGEPFPSITAPGSQEHLNTEADVPVSRSNSLTKRSWRRRPKEDPSTPKAQDLKSKNNDQDPTDTSGALTKDKRYGSRNWLSSNNKSRSRPVSEANASSNGFVRGLKGVMSRDKLVTSFHTGGHDDQQTDDSTHGEPSPVNSAAPSFTFALGGHNREKSDVGREKQPARKKSNGKKKGRSRKEKDVANGINGSAVEGGASVDGGSEDGNSDRQCAVM
jgi:hypothetical protein